MPTRIALLFACEARFKTTTKGVEIPFKGKSCRVIAPWRPRRTDLLRASLWRPRFHLRSAQRASNKGYIGKRKASGRGCTMLGRRLRRAPRLTRTGLDKGVLCQATAFRSTLDEKNSIETHRLQ